MLCNYHRSSSLGTLSMCEMKYFFVYNLGFKDKTNKAAVLGTITHRALQVLADKRVAMSSGKKTVDFEGKRLKLADCDNIERITELAFDHYAKYEPQLDLGAKDLKKCIDWMYTAIGYNGGELDPRNQDVFATELFFDFEIKEDWAKYSYVLKDQEYSGYLSIKGTIDLVLNVDTKHYQVLDFKTGQRKNWATGKIKEYEDLEYDTQLLLYYFALRNLYPDCNFDVSIFFINHGGLFTFPYEQKHYVQAENILRQKFEYIQKIQVPRQVSRNPDHPTCKYMCAFSQEYENTGKSICDTYHGMIKKDGILPIIEQYADIDSLGKYTGGGRIEKKI